MYSLSFNLVTIFNVLVLLNGFKLISTEDMEPVVVLTDSSGGHTIVGHRLTLKCKTTFYKNDIFFKWELPKGFNSTPIIKGYSHDNNAIYKSTSNLRVEQADSRHSGVYKCTVVYKQWNQSFVSSALQVPIYESNEHILAFDTTPIIFKDGYPYVEVHFKSHPHILSVVWFRKINKINETITGESSSKFSVSTAPLHKGGEFNYYTRLTFKNITLEDIRLYMVVAKNAFGSKMQPVFIHLVPNGFKMGLEVINASKDVLVYKCQAIGYPKPVLTMDFNTFSLTTESQYSTSTPDNSLQTVLPFFLNSSISGGLNCYIVNFVDYTTLKFPHKSVYVLSERKKGFHLWGSNEYRCVKDNNEIYVCHVTFRTDVDIKYKVSPYYTAERWIVNGKRLTSRTEFKGFHFKYVYEQQMGSYTLELLSRSGEIYSVSFKMVSEKIPTFYPEVSVQDLNNGHTVIGQDIRLKCQLIYYTQVYIGWDLRQGYISGDCFLCKMRRRGSYREKKTFNRATFTMTSEIEMESTKDSKSTSYACGYTNRGARLYGPKSIWVSVYGDNETVISFEENESAFEVKKMEINIFILAHPAPTIKWYNNNDDEILSNSSSKFSVHTNPMLENDGKKYNYKTTLKFVGVIELTDFGNYTVSATNQYQQGNYSVSVNLTGIPKVHLELEEFDEKIMTSIIKCVAVGYPEVTVKWHFAQCLATESCGYETEILDDEYREMDQSHWERIGVKYISYIRVNMSAKGMVRCVGANSFGEDYSYQHIFFIKDGFDIFHRNITTSNSTKTLDSVKSINTKVMCAASIFKYKERITWLSFTLNDGVMEQLSEDTSSFALKATDLFARMSLLEIQLDSTGDNYYTCNGLTKDGSLKSQILLVRVRDSAYLFVENNNIGTCPLLEHVGTSEECELYCHVSGYPTPVVKWYKDDQPLNSSDRIHFLKDNQVLKLTRIQQEDIGLYKCEASNGYEVQIRSKPVLISAINQTNWIVLALLPSLLVTVVIVSYLCLKLRKERRLNQELKLSGLDYFEQGDLKGLNSELTIGDQAELLPYDGKWEIPIDNIKLGKQLGSGAFGVVLKAEIVNFFPDETSKTVAVKTVSKHSGFEHIKVLASELKIMGYVGKHINIINLLGAYTKEISKKKLYVVVEYCHFGNLQSYLHRYGTSFVDQKNPETDTFDWEIRPENEFPAVTFTGQTVAYVNCQQDNDQQKICSKDFLTWAFQIARGMEYLGSRRVLHGDLAARNILLTENNVIKVSDFGLARKMYEQNNYIKKGEERLPIKWLAIEALGRGIFSIQSDIWAFGIVLWEIFSLGETPYPGILFDETFYKKLVDGYRMEQPTTATTEIYSIMRNCWNFDPQLRPSFASLIQDIGSLLEEPVKQHYINMNNGFVLMNQQELDSDQEDYLAMVSPPTFENIAREVVNHDYANSTTQVSDDHTFFENGAGEVTGPGLKLNPTSDCELH